MNCVADAQYSYSRHSRLVIILLKEQFQNSKSFPNQKSASESDMKILNNLLPIFAEVEAAKDQRIL